MANVNFQNALNLISQNTPPVWMMRQAGRYHNHYQNLKKSYSFEQLCKTPLLAAETALGPIRDFDFDTAILFSDILFPLEALGMGLKYDPAPQLSFNLTAENFHLLRGGDEAARFMNFQKEAMVETRKALPHTKSLVGFIGGPLTLFGYAVEGSHKGALKETKRQLDLYPRFEELVLPLLEHNISIQLEGGAEVVMLFDTTAGEFAPSLFHANFSNSLRKLVRRFEGRLGYYSKGTTIDHLNQKVFEDENWAGFGVDHRFELPKLLKSRRLPGFLQGNFDQTLLFLEPEKFEACLETYLEPFKQLSNDERKGWVCGLGHGVLPMTPERNVKRFVELVRKNFL